LYSSILLVLCIPSAHSAKINLPVFIEHNNALDHKRHKNVVGGVGRLIFTVVTKSVAAKVKRVEIKLAASLR